MRRPWRLCRPTNRGKTQIRRFAKPGRHCRIWVRKGCKGLQMNSQKKYPLGGLRICKRRWYHAVIHATVKPDRYLALVLKGVCDRGFGEFPGTPLSGSLVSENTNSRHPGE
jgi:hypothetical protein